MENVQYIEVSKIIPNKHQPRINFDNKDLVELAESIMTNGLIQPIVVRPRDSGFEIIAGERRFRACSMLHHEKVPCIVLEASDVESAHMALVENIQRSDLSAIEEAIAYVKLMEETNITQSDLAKQMGKSQSAIANKIRLLSLPDTVQQLVSEKVLTERHGRALLGIKAEQMDKVVKQVVEKKLNVAQTEKLIEDIKFPKKKVKEDKVFSKNIKIGINTLKHAREICAKSGIESTFEIEETDKEVLVIIKFAKEG